MDDVGAWVQFYEKFVADFEHRLNILSLTEILVPVAESVDPAKGVTFLEAFKVSHLFVPRIGKGGRRSRGQGKRLVKESGGGTEKTESEKEALVLANSTIIRLRLSVKDAKGKVPPVPLPSIPPCLKEWRWDR